MISKENYVFLSQVKESDRFIPSADQAKRVESLLRDGLLEAQIIDGIPIESEHLGGVRFMRAYTLSVSGADALSEFAAKAQEKHDREEQLKHDNRKKHIWDIALLLIGGAITLFVEHFEIIFAWIKSLFD